MRYLSKPREVIALQFKGTSESALEIQDWLSSHDVTCVSATWNESLGTDKRTVLDLATETTNTDVEAGDWIIIDGAEVRAHTEMGFREYYSEVLRE